MKYLKQIDIQTIIFLLGLIILNRLGIIGLLTVFILGVTRFVNRVVGGLYSDNRADYEHIGYLNINNKKVWIIDGVALLVIGVLGYLLPFF